MNLLAETLSPQVNLQMQGIDTKRAKTFADVIRILLETRKSHPGNEDGTTWAERQARSVNLPLRSLIVQQVGLTKGEIAVIRNESIEALTEYKLAQIEAGKEGIDLSVNEKEVADWMSGRVSKALQEKVILATNTLVGDIALIGFQMEEKVAETLKQKLEAHDRERVEREAQNDGSLALAA